MPYRSDHDTKEARREALAAELATVRDALARAEAPDAELASEERRLLRAIRGLGLPRKRATPPSASLAERLRITKPCSEDWDAMIGEGRTRHCTRCGKNVHDVTGMRRAEVVALLAREDDSPCIRYAVRSDGTIVLGDDCPRPAPKVALRVLAASACVVAVGLAAGVTEGHANEATYPQVPVTAWSTPPTHTYHLGGRPPATAPTPSVPRAPWERADVVEAGFESLAPFFGAPTVDTPEEDDERARLPRRIRTRRTPHSE